MLERDPTSDTQLRVRLDGLRSLRVGTYRIIYRLADDDQTARVAAIRHRSIPYGSAPADVRRVRNAASAAAIRSMNAMDAARRALGQVDRTLRHRRPFMRPCS